MAYNNNDVPGEVLELAEDIASLPQPEYECIRNMVRQALALAQGEGIDCRRLIYGKPRRGPRYRAYITQLERIQKQRRSS